MNKLDASPDSNSTGVLIVGAGPIGLEIAVAFKRNGIPFQLVDAGAIGQTISWWAPGTRWFSSNQRISIAGVPLVTPDQSKATREQYLAYLRSVAEQFQIAVRTYESVVDIRRQETGFIATTNPSSGCRELHCRQIVLAIGGTDFPRPLGVEGEDLPHVDGYLREPHRYYRRRVLIVGGRNSAVEGALRLHHAGAIVSISYRGSELPADGIKYWLLPEIRGLIEAGVITAYFNSQVERISAGAVTLTHSNRQSGSASISVPADDVLSLIGYEQDKTLLEIAGLELSDDVVGRPIINDQTMESSVPGIYVAGTAFAGTQNSKYKTFLENCHPHVEKIVAHLTERAPVGTDAKLQQQIAAHPES